MVLIGIGNPYRRDDGVGPALIVAAGADGLPGVRLVAADGEPAALIEAWQDADLAVVVDAVLCRVAAARPGAPHRLARAGRRRGRAPRAVRGAPARTASASLMRCGWPRCWTGCPGRLVVFAVEAADLGFGTGLSAAVAAACPG